MEERSFNNKNKELGEVLSAINEELAREKLKHRQGAYNMLAQKKNDFLLDQENFIRQMEKNIIYSAEGTMDVLKAIGVYIESDYRQLRDQPAEDIVKFVQNVPAIESRARTEAHLDYLYDKCSGCKYHDQHTEYEDLKTLKVAGDNQQYIDELEFNYIYHQVQNMIVKQYLLVFIQNDEKMAGIFKSAEDLEQIKMNLHLMTNFILDNIVFEREEKSGE